MRAYLAASAALLLTACAPLANVTRVIPQAAPYIGRTPYGYISYQVPVRPGAGGIVESFSAPASLPMTGETKLGNKRGSGKVTYIREPFFTGVPILAWGDVSVDAIARENGIKQVNHVDYRVLSILQAYIEFELLVYGD